MLKKGFTFRVYLSYIICAIIAIFIIGFNIFYFLYYAEGREVKMTDVMAFLTGSVAICTLLYYSFSLERTDYFHQENLKLNRHQYSYEVVSRMTDPSMAESASILVELRETKSEQLEENNIKDFIEFLKVNPEKRTKLILILNYFEHMSLLVENKHVEEGIIKASFKTLFTSTYSLLKAYIDERQKTHRKSWIKFEELSKKWSKEQ